MLARGRLAQPEFVGDVDPANTVFNEIAVNLHRKVRSRILEPIQNQQAPIVRKGAQRSFERDRITMALCHIANLPYTALECQPMSITRIAPGARMSQATIYNGTVFIAGQVDDSQSTTVAGQAKRILEKIDALLAQAGTNRSRVLSANVWLSDIATYDEMNAVWEAWIDPNNPPARATVESRLAGAEYKIEIAAIAALGDS